MKYINRLTSLAVMLLVVACSSGINIQTDYDPQAVPQIAAYKTYSWLPDPPGGRPGIDQLTVSRIVRAVDTVLAGKGFQKRTSGRSDFTVGWHGAVQGKVDYTTVNSYYGYGYGRWGAGGFGTGVSTTTAREYNVGTLIIDLVDGQSNQLVWRGSAQAELDESGTPEERQENAIYAVGEIFKDFPPTG